MSVKMKQGKKTGGTQRREETLSLDRIVEASIALLDSSGAKGLTFRALSERLATGPGAIYWHIGSKSELLTAACDAIVAQTMNAPVEGKTPTAIIRGLSLAIFDAIDEHPWVGSALARAPGQLPMVRILERIGQQLRALGVAAEDEWPTVSALLSYILGVGGQNAANTHFAQEQGLDRSNFLDEVSAVWLQFNPDEYPFTRSVAGQLRSHDDRVDFLAGIDLMLRGIESARSR